MGVHDDMIQNALAEHDANKNKRDYDAKGKAVSPMAKQRESEINDVMRQMQEAADSSFKRPLTPQEKAYVDKANKGKNR